MNLLYPFEAMAEFIIKLFTKLASFFKRPKNQIVEKTPEIIIKDIQQQGLKSIEQDLGITQIKKGNEQEFNHVIGDLRLAALGQYNQQVNMSKQSEYNQQMATQAAQIPFGIQQLMIPKEQSMSLKERLETIDKPFNPSDLPNAAEMKQTMEAARLAKISEDLGRYMKKIHAGIKKTSEEGYNDFILTKIVPENNVCFAEVCKILKEKGYTIIQNSMTKEYVVRWA